MPMTPEAKKALSTTIRGLRARLLEDLHAETVRVYRLGVRAQDAGLPARERALRERLEGWIAEQQRADGAGGGKARARGVEEHLGQVVEQAASTLLNRLVVLRLLEAPGPGGAPLRAPAVVTGGWNSRGYQDFRSLAPALVRGDPTEGYALLLDLLVQDLATELPGIFGPVGLAELVPVPPATLRHCVEQLDRPELAGCWTDEMTLGWVYQYWNDPAREALDDKLNRGGKVEPHEVASKTQMFTERYMVDWLLQNSLGPMWLAICARHGWTARVQADGTLDRLEQRRQDWRARRQAGQVALTDRMPVHTETERRWVYFVPQPLPPDAVTQAPESLRELRLLDPAVGSGHFLVVALDLLAALYREEAAHRGLSAHPDWTDRAIVERILSHNLHGIDLDPRAVQIAAAALWIRAQHLAPGARPTRLHLVASNLRLGSLPDQDPALVELRSQVERETGIPGSLTDTLLAALRGADHLGSLLKVDKAVDEALDQHEARLGRAVGEQGGLFTGFAAERPRVPIGRDQARASLLERLEGFLARHTGSQDLGLRLRGEQLAAGVRFVRMVREGSYDLVVANPPYQGTSKLADKAYVERAYPLGKADLYAAFLLRGLELVRPGGVSAMLTMRNWMFIKQYAGLRERLLATFDLRALGDFAVGAFDEVPNDVLSVVVSVFHRASQRPEESVALQPTPVGDTSYDRARTNRKRAATLCQEGHHRFDPAVVARIAASPILYWWSRDFVESIASLATIGSESPPKVGAISGNNTRFVRKPWEIREQPPVPLGTPITFPGEWKWMRFLKGGSGRYWFDPVDDVINWTRSGLETKQLAEKIYGSHSRQIRNEALYATPGVAFTMIGSEFSARMHRWRSIIDGTATSVFSPERAYYLCLLNSRTTKQIMSDFNPTIHFEIGDVVRIPLFQMNDADAIVARAEAAFTLHEAHREPSVEFRRPGRSPWRAAQDWAQAAVDRPEGAPLPAYVEELDPEPPTDHLSFALGVALGRFGPEGSDREGILVPATADLSHALPDGLLFLDGTLEASDLRDGLGHPAAAPLHRAWATHGPALGSKRALRDWLALDFFKDVHRAMYENRPIHWPLSSSGRTFVAWVNIHRFTERTLPILLADHLVPTLGRIDGELADLRAARDGADRAAARAAEKRLERVRKARDELAAFIAAVETCADQGPPPVDARCPPREQDARYAPDLDDGVMINAAALWPLLEPQWKDPKKWWRELANAAPGKDYDWAHLAMRYWPTRVDGKCEADPSLGVAHGCFWRYHPARAWAWELRLQDEIGPDFRIEEPPYRPGGRELGDGGDGPHRATFLASQPDLALAAIEKEATRRMGRGKDRRPVPELRLLEAGLWTTQPEALWDLELRLSEKQGAELRILAPDEPSARAAFAAAWPDRVQARATRLANLVPPTLFDAPEDDDEPVEDESGDSENET